MVRRQTLTVVARGMVEVMVYILLYRFGWLFLYTCTCDQL